MSIPFTPGTDSTAPPVNPAHPDAAVVDWYKGWLRRYSAAEAAGDKETLKALAVEAEADDLPGARPAPPVTPS